VLADARIEDKTAEQFDLVYATKVGGLRSLLSALPGDELRALVLFSSITGRLGRVGQSDYAMANEVLNKLARQHARRWPHCRVVAVNWGPWDGGMVTPGLKQRFAQEGVGLIGPEAGGAFLVRELAAPERDVEVVVSAGGACEPAPSRGSTEPKADTGTSTAGDELDEPARPGSGAALLPTAFARAVGLEECPVLASHVLDGRPVLPMALVLEWLAQAALHQNPGLTFVGMNDLRILHGVRLDEMRPVALRVAAGKALAQDGVHLAPVEVHGQRPDGRNVVHARAAAVLAERPGNETDGGPAMLPAWPAYRHAMECVYRDFLFHGPDLQAIECVEGCGPDGILARVRTAPAPGAWLRRPLRQRWVADPLVLDAVFQLMILWSQERHGAPGLPCFVRSYRQFRRSFPLEGARIACRITHEAAGVARADVDVLDLAGLLVARIEGCECTLDPGLVRAFRHNRLEAACGAGHGQ
jgi:hypothetical protein